MLGFAILPELGCGQKSGSAILPPLPSRNQTPAGNTGNHHSRIDNRVFFYRIPYALPGIITLFSRVLCLVRGIHTPYG